MFSMPSGMELLVILFIVLIIFGAGKLPNVGKQLGSAISEFKTSVKSKDEADSSASTENAEKKV